MENVSSNIILVVMGHSYLATVSVSSGSSLGIFCCLYSLPHIYLICKILHSVCHNRKCTQIVLLTSIWLHELYFVHCGCEVTLQMWLLKFTVIHHCPLMFHFLNWKTNLWSCANENIFVTDTVWPALDC